VALPALGAGQKIIRVWKDLNTIDASLLLRSELIQRRRLTSQWSMGRTLPWNR